MKSAGELRAAFDRGFAEPHPPRPGARVGLIAISVGGTGYAIAVAQIAAVHVDVQIGSAPSTVRSLAGLATIRNAILPVHDLGVVLRHRARPITSRWLAVVGGEAPRAWMFEALDGQVVVERGTFTTTVEIAGRSRPVLDLEELRHAT